MTWVNQSIEQWILSSSIRSPLPRTTRSARTRQREFARCLIFEWLFFVLNLIFFLKKKKFQSESCKYLNECIKYCNNWINVLAFFSVDYKKPKFDDYDQQKSFLCFYFYLCTKKNRARFIKLNLCAVMKNFTHTTKTTFYMQH